jgi:hypothetical protein
MDEKQTSCLTSKTCARCGETKPTTEFYRQKGGLLGLGSRCRQCESARGKARYAAHTPTEEYLRHRENNRLKRNFGITLEDYEAMAEMQEHRCQICGVRDSGRAGAEKFAVDHCHKTMKIRGLLCSRCNQALGLFGDNPNVLRKAAAYLERANGQRDEPLC